MRFRACIFDIDGTLVLTGGAGLRALAWACDGLAAAARYPDLPEDFSPHGKTDPLIFRELCLHFTGREPDDDLLKRLEASYLGRFPAEMESTRAHYRVLPGVHHLLESLARLGTLLGLGTGNYEASARQKLAPGGLNRFFPFGSYGSDAEHRAEMIAIAYERACLEADRRGVVRPRRDQTLVIGDTTRDIAAAHAAGLPCLAVATGPQSVEDLAGAELAVASLATPEALRFLGVA